MTEISHYPTTARHEIPQFGTRKMSVVQLHALIWI